MFRVFRHNLKYFIVSLGKCRSYMVLYNCIFFTNIKLILGEIFMLKKARLINILDLVNRNGIITSTSLANTLGVSDMTIRRDLDELEKNSRLIRIHGGAESLSYNIKNEIDHEEKQTIHRSEKLEAAEIAASLIEESDSIFLGSGSTIELMAQFINLRFIRIVTNSLPVFESFRNKMDSYEVILIGGNFRPKTGAFIGGIVQEALEKLYFSKCFIGVNGIFEEDLYMAGAEEARSQRIALNNSVKRYIVADYYKVHRSDFYKFYKLSDVTGIITNKALSAELQNVYSQYTKMIISKN